VRDGFVLRSKKYMDRRTFLDLSSKTLAASFGLGLLPLGSEAKGNGFFRLQQKKGQYTLIDPRGEAFFSLGLNHLDPSPLLHPENLSIWRDKYHNSMEEWLQQVRADLLDWGFNSVGWVHDVATKRKDHHRHSRNFTYEEYQWLGLPYCHALPFADFHHYESEMRHPDFFSAGFADWCDHVARTHCARMAEDPLLIGYFYVDCPAWIHNRQESDWKGPLFDPEKLQTEAGKTELFRLASQYYRLTYEAIRRYDPHHLILGDRYEANRPWTPVVFEAAKPYVDVMSFQNFSLPEKLKKQMNHFAQLTGKPVLIADVGVPDYDSAVDGKIPQDLERYTSLLKVLPEIPANIGMHFCGAYYRNRQRRYGLKDEKDQVDVLTVKTIRNANHAFLSQ
jgi:hypothetical protein